MSADEQAILDAFGVTAEELAHFGDLTGYRAARDAAEAERREYIRWAEGQLVVLRAAVDAEVARLDARGATPYGVGGAERSPSPNTDPGATP